ncbi:MAG: hypothetical protein JXA96_13910 [Sedimentisphaerales bacterium]|nr:hypothetical protein [Sedimentisphaerales bacterium]
MTIEFNCPKCNSVIAFADKHAGKRAHCSACNQSFFIPDKSFGKIQTIKPPKEKPSDPIPGFYHAALIDNWKLFFNPKNITGMVFTFVAAIFYFFNGHRNIEIPITTKSGGVITIFLPFGWLCTGLSWGFLFWYYREIIYETGYDQENFPEVILGGFYSFIWKVASSCYSLFIIFIAVSLPSIFIYIIFKNIFESHHVLSLFIYSFSLLFLPVAIMNVAIGKDLLLLRPDYLIKQVVRGFKPYLVVYVYLSTAIFMQLFSIQFIPKDPTQIGIGLVLNIVSQLMLIFSIRAIGLFYRHYSCHAPW